MQADKLLKVITQLTKDAEEELNNRLPRKVAVIAKRHFRDNFRLSGFMDGGLHQWQRAIRQHGSSTSAQYRTLTSARNHLMSSIEAVPSKASLLVYNPIAYAHIHNEGGDMISTPTVTPKMKSGFGHNTTKLKTRAEGTKLSYEDRGRGGTEGISYISW